MYALPVVRFVTLCLLLPFFILPMLGSPEEQPRGGNPSYSFNALPTYKFKENGESGVLAAGTDKERAISGEDAVSSITKNSDFMPLNLASCTWWKNAAIYLKD